MEAGGLQDIQDDFIAETGLDFSFLFALYAGGSGSPATAADCEAYAETIGTPSFPVFADGKFTIVNATPMTQAVHPEICAFAPDMTIINCYTVHGNYADALDAIREHAGL